MNRITKIINNLKIRHIAYTMGVVLATVVILNYFGSRNLRLGTDEIALLELVKEVQGEAKLLEPRFLEVYDEEEFETQYKIVRDELLLLRYGGDIELNAEWIEIEEATGENAAMLDALIQHLQRYREKYVTNSEIEQTHFGRYTQQLTDYEHYLTQDLIDQSNNYDLVMLFALIITFGIYSLIYYVMRYLIMGPIYRISSNSRKLAKGNLNERIDLKGTNEIGRIAGNINDLADMLENATQFTREIGKGNLDVRYGDQDESDVDTDSIAGALVDMREQMKNIAKSDQQRNWSTEGLAKFAEILRASEENSDDLANVIVSELVEYLNANQGRIYFMNENSEQRFLELKGSYAFARKKSLEQQIEIGSGLIGQSVLEKKITLLTNVPEDYITIRSGLGDAPPRCILIVPLMMNEEVNGVIEIASFSIIEQYQIEFIEKLGESIASTLASSMANRKTSLLLEETKTKTQEIMVREEEMRQNMEELMATQEEMERQEKEYISIIQDLRTQIANDGNNSN